MHILIVAPTKNEYLSMKRTLDTIQHAHHYSLIQSGVGKAAAASTTAINVFHPAAPKFDLIAVIGYAAASTSYEQGEIVIPNQACYHDADCPSEIVPELTKIYPLQGSDNCIILTGDSFVTKELADKLTEKYGSSVLFDMEATAICQVADQSETPVVVIKYVSDIPQSDSQNLQTFEDFSSSKPIFPEVLAYLESLI